MKCRTLASLGMVTILAAGAVFSGCEATPKTAGDKAVLSTEVQSTLTAFKNADPSLQQLLSRSSGYAVFPQVGKAGFIAGGAYGKGEVFQNGMMIGYADITQGTIGLQVGAQTYDELVIFMDDGQLRKFKSGDFAFSANASAVAIKAGAAAAADTSKGSLVFVRTTGGLMAEASIGGQNFAFTPK